MGADFTTVLNDTYYYYEDIYDCVEQEDNKIVHLFVEGFDGVLMFHENVSPQTYENWEKFTAQFDTGETIDSSFYSIQTALAAYQAKSLYRYKNVEMNIWLMKGTHHFIQCIDPTSVDGDVSGSYNIPNLEIDPVTGQWPDWYYYSAALLCSNDTAGFPWVADMSQFIQEYDNVKFYFRAMTCQESMFTLGNLAYDFDPAGQFYDQCVDLETDAKPQIRISNPYTYFNITRYALFQNIDFSGEDLFAHANYATNGFLSPWGATAFFPVKKCTVVNDPVNLFDELRFFTGKNTIEALSGISYRCQTGIDQSTRVPPSDVDDRCFPEYNPQPVTSYCTGEPYSTDFFTRVTKNFIEGGQEYYPYRHKTLFNLYAFD